ncbi:conserved hypothetical protein [Mesorhizobium prunaredense]|uniref:Uncharacterized protein n=1 Tax=Mesorhizobium prunaredense TaxID=1631249 RepID=A0A1R3V9I1_9HYPH|nr:conserved hypothetical protein [Mesorhizobium prunaredense]
MDQKWVTVLGVGQAVMIGKNEKRRMQCLRHGLAILTEVGRGSGSSRAQPHVALQSGNDGG